MQPPPLLKDWNPNPNTSYPLHYLPIEIQEMFEDINKVKKDYLQIIEKRQQLITLPEVLHHYTNVFGLKGIAFDNKIWFNDYRTTNDPTEGIYAKKLIREIFQKNMEFPLHISEITEDAQLFFDSIIDRQFIACFTENPDHLSQWIHYGNSGSGYCIGVDTSHLLSRELPVDESVLKIKIFPIIYDKQQQEKEIEEFFEYFLQIYEKYKPLLPLNQHVIRYLKSELFELETWFAQLCSLKYKNEYYKDEQEWRCVISIPPSSASRYITPLRVSGNSLVSYIPIDVFVRTIKSGPKTNHSHLSYAVAGRKIYGALNGKQLQLTHSVIAYR